MTDVTPNPKARYIRLNTRARDVLDVVTRLEEDLRGSEGKSCAQMAQESLSSLCLILESKINTETQ